MLLVVLRDVRTDFRHGFFARRVSYRGCPRPSRVQRVPGRAFICPSIRAVPMFPEALADFHFFVPDWTEPMNEKVFRRLHPRATNDEIPAKEVAESKIVRTSDGAVVIL